ncbi:UDP-N-acetylmuramate--L-alanine ligase [Candidatus Babeliales bacterium]|nr:UDP-N-acetylmuramate--L-alanine ligase [Candidatus Babeliales bacterium]MCF7899547.1 UDP-N-acetylmuramate--L-alanine ligase [Candidatus Babeliales bacterium]
MYKKCKHIHFIGIGGIGMSGIAKILKLKGYTVSGCDECSKSKVISQLSEIGCKIYTGHNSDHIKDVDVLVYSSAVKPESPEVLAALTKGIPVIPRAIMLAELMRTKYGIAVSGSHGKTTTTSMISHILMEANLDPTVIIGGILKNISNNAKLGEGNLLIAEADESDRSLLYLNPTFAIVTNIDAEHLDTYKDLEDVKDTFKNFLARLPFYGKAFLCIDDPNVKAILPLPHISATKYGLSEAADIRGEIINIKNSQSIFNVYKSNQILGQITLNMPGEHNILNSLAATALSLELDIPFKKIQNALNNFKGVERRFEYKGSYKGADIFDDYGHHPTEIHNTLKIAINKKDKNLHVIFQPHKFSRTQKLWKEFIDVFDKREIDNLYITDIYPASEAPIENITSSRLVEEIKKRSPNLKIFYCKTYEEITQIVKDNLDTGDLLLTVGAGKVNLIGEKLLEL